MATPRAGGGLPDSNLYRQNNMSIQIAPRETPPPRPFDHLRRPSAAPIRPRPFGPRPFAPRPFGPHPFGPHPFGPHPFGPHPFGPHPFGPHPFGPHPFGRARAAPTQPFGH